uniref:Uncharacterized protein n=1 Tax=Romanomermis culicivorax TaxID=13658 RepID=A0A915JSD7_ROMCU
MLMEHAMNVSIHKHLVNEFHHIVLPILLQNQCHIYMAPLLTNVAGWAEVVVSNVQQRLHHHIVNIISNRSQNYDE